MLNTPVQYVCMHAYTLVVNLESSDAVVSALVISPILLQANICMTITFLYSLVLIVGLKKKSGYGLDSDLQPSAPTKVVIRSHRDIEQDHTTCLFNIE
jgi:hypothetical protein